MGYGTTRWGGPPLNGIRRCFSCRSARTTFFSVISPPIVRKSAPLPRGRSRSGELRGPSGHRDGERTAADRNARGPRAADRDYRSLAGHQLLHRDLAPVSTRCSKKPSAYARPPLQPTSAANASTLARSATLQAGTGEFVRQPHLAGPCPLEAWSGQSSSSVADLAGTQYLSATGLLGTGRLGGARTVIWQCRCSRTTHL